MDHPSLSETGLTGPQQRPPEQDNARVATVSDPPLHRPLSDAAVDGLRRLQTLLEGVRRMARRWIWVESMALVCLAGAAVFWVTLAFDWAVEPPSWVRGGLMMAGLVGLMVILRHTLFGRLAVPMGDTTLATVVERGQEGFRDSLSTAIELSARPREDIDPRLLERTILEAVAVVGRVDPGQFFRRRRLAGVALAGLTALGSLVGVAVARPGIADIWTRRMLFLDDTPWPRRTGLSIEGFTDGVRKVARGADAEIIVRADAAREGPEVVDLRIRPLRGGAWRSDRMGIRGGSEEGSQAFGQVLKGMTEDLELEVRGGDARLRGLRLTVVDAPALARLDCTATLPAYLGGGSRQVAASRVLMVPRGAAVEIGFVSTKPLSTASVHTLIDGEETLEVSLPAIPGDQPASAASGIDPPQSITLRIGEVDGERTLVARFTDTDGLGNREPITVVLGAVPDEPPQVAVRMRGISTAVTPQARLPLVGAISDDYALASADVTIAIKDGATTTLPIARVKSGAVSIEFSDASPELVTLESLALPLGAAISLQVAARDQCTLSGGDDGGANEGRSDTWSLDVVPPESLMAMLEAREILLRRRFESVVSDLALARERLAAGIGTAGGQSELPAAGGDDAGDGSGDLPGRADWGLEGARLVESAARAGGETGEIAEAFRMIRQELDNNRMLSDELESRLIGQIAQPLTAIAGTDLPELQTAGRKSTAVDREALVTRSDEVLVRMRAVLDKMMELESYNEVIELLRGVIRTQEEIRAETLRRQRQRAKEALERP